MIKKATSDDSFIIAEMAGKMWDTPIDELAKDFEKIIEDNESVVFVMYTDEKPVGFAQCQLRHDYVEGTDSSPVGYLEGIFIEQEYRHKGYAKKLLLECEQWAKESGCTEFASDCELNNSASLSFHLNVGFAEAGRIICFKKTL